ncbi:MAG: hypothetical protein H7Y00_09800 [Fimbriimonadaceae bacterium]|nr:hypothetical protein [Chitinophagales bacterium]
MQKFFLCLFFSTLFIVNTKADSPITSTYIYPAYLDYEIVNYAIETGSVDEKIASYLSDENNLMDVKVAVINAIGWNYEGNKNSHVFLDHLAKQNNTTAEKLNKNDLSGSNLLCFGYLLAMDDYFNIAESFEIVTMAKEKLNTSYTAHLVHAIVGAQKEFDYNWCGIWQITRNVLTNNSLKRDMRTTAIQSVVDYMILYKSYCLVAE